MLKEIEAFNEEQMTESPDRVDIVCTTCKGKVGYIIPAECEVPLVGTMIHPHLGCENWDLPGPHAGALDFICPHAATPPDGDQHLFIDIIEGHHEETDTFLTDEHKPYRIQGVSGKCPCGCGGDVRGDNKYTDNLRCYRRAMARLKAEIEDGRTNS
jgi:hypothetical protein